MSVKTTSDWWARARAGDRQPIRDGHPQEGYYAASAGRGHATAPARIWSEAGRFYCTIAGENRKAMQEWPYLSRRPISAETYEQMMKRLNKVDPGPRGRRRTRMDDIPPPF